MTSDAPAGSGPEERDPPTERREPPTDAWPGGQPVPPPTPLPPPSPLPPTSPMAPSSPMPSPSSPAPPPTPSPPPPAYGSPVPTPSPPPPAYGSPVPTPSPPPSPSTAYPPPTPAPPINPPVADYAPAGGYASPYQSYPGQAARGTNTMAILALVLALVFSPAGIICGHIARRQIAQTGEDGAGLATAGMVIGYVITGLYVLGCCGFVMIAGLGGTVG
jgi:hypothetical protein